MFVLELLGTLCLRDGTRPVPLAAQQKRRLGLLALLGLGGRHGLSRDRVEAYLWPESSAPREIPPMPRKASGNNPFFDA